MTREPIRRGSIDVAVQAARAAEAAASAAGLRIVELDTVDRIREATDLLNVAWSATREEPLIPANTLRAIQHSGNYVFGAYVGDTMLGTIVGFLGRHDGAPQLHSHILGVAPATQDRSIGFALKEHQRAWALGQGIDLVTWTFDPLVRRNAYFNITKLGATIGAYHANFYGEMNDGINDGDESDRVLVEWHLRAQHVVDASERRPREIHLGELQEGGGAVVLEMDSGGGPAVREGSGGVLLARIPEDIVTLRANDPDRARAWRTALRNVLGGALRDGYAAVGMSRSGWYVLRGREGGTGR